MKVKLKDEIYVLGLYILSVYGKYVEYIYSSQILS